MKPSEQIVGVAILIGGEVISLPRPNRHHNLFPICKSRGFKAPYYGEQGFITDTGRFLNRIEGGKLALENGQVQKLHAPPELFSEDVW